MNRKFLTLIAICIVGSVEAQVQGTSFATAKATNQATLTYVYNNTTSFAKETDQKEMSGILIDLMVEFEAFVKEKYGITISREFHQIERNDFGGLLNTVKTSREGVFGLANTSITEERKQFLQFSQPFLQNIVVLVTHKNIPDIASMEDMSTSFADMKAYSVTASVYLASLEKLKASHFPEMEIELFRSGLEVMEAVASNPKSFAIIDLLYYLEFLNNGYELKRHKVGDQVGDEFGIIMPTNNDWKPVLDEFFATGFLKSARYREIVSNHLGKSALRLIKLN